MIFCNGDIAKAKIVTSPSCMFLGFHKNTTKISEDFCVFKSSLLLSRGKQLSGAKSQRANGQSTVPLEATWTISKATKSCNLFMMYISCSKKLVLFVIGHQLHTVHTYFTMFPTSCVSDVSNPPQGASRTPPGGWEMVRCHGFFC